MFRSALKSRRCIIPASGFYEWTGKAGSKTPHYFSAPSGAPLAFAGLWETWRDPESDARVDSATIIVDPGERMDVALSPPNAGHTKLARTSAHGWLGIIRAHCYVRRLVTRCRKNRSGVRTMRCLN
jgi:hypothetical protein